MLLALSAALVVGPRTGFPYDDAYITLHNARVLLQGGVDPNYSVPALVGATSPVHLALVALLGLALPLTTASLMVGFLAMAAYAAGLAAMARQAAAPPLLTLLAVILGLGIAFAPMHLLNGLETGLMMAAVTWALVFASRMAPTRGLALLCGLLPFIRPELALLSVLLMTRQAWQRARTRDVHGLLIDVALCGAAAIPWLAWVYLTTGAIVPATAGAKGAYFAEQGWPLTLKAAFFMYAVRDSMIGPILLALLAVGLSALGRWLLVFCAVLLLAFVLTFPGGMAHNDSRYLQLFLPISVYSALWLWRTRPRWGGSLLLAATAWLIVTSPQVWRDCMDAGRWTAAEAADTSRWLTDNLPAYARLLVHDAGYPAFATDFVLIDVVGLKTPAAVEHHQRWTAPSAGAQRHRAIAEIAERFRPTHAVILQDDLGFWRSVGDALRQHGWIEATLREPPARVGYVVYRLSRPREQAGD